ncbi:hypothetical protein EOL70_05570 [Leucothrix sargassi]|nr:hypothetical protein EOL70_05570 [Leucothrix sargassi]
MRSILTATLAVGVVSQATAQYSPNPRLGSNVGSADKLAASVAFTDIFKSSTGWYTSCEFNWQTKQGIDPGCTQKNAFHTREKDLLDLDANGWVRSLPTPEQSPIFTSVTSSWSLPDSFPLGRYVALYEGQATIKLTGDLKIVANQPGRLVFDLVSAKRNLRMNLSNINPANYLRNLKIVPIQNEANHRRQIFNPDYVARMRPLHVLRFMPWSNPRGNDVEEWQNRAPIETAHFTGPKGVPAERMIDLANATDTAPWISVPYKASDDYVLQYARMVKNRLRPNQKVYLEYSNEMWNVIFPGTTYAARKADKLWNFPYKEKNAYQRRVSMAANWYAKRTVEMCQIWKKEFGNQSGRVVCVLASQSSAPWAGKETLDCPLWKEANGCGRYVDAYAIGPYFGDYIARKEHRETVKSWLKDPDGGMNRLFTEIESGGQVDKETGGGSIALTMNQYVKQNVQLAQKYGLPLMAYEAGQHLIRFDPPHTVKDPAVLNLFMSAQKHPRMRDAYNRYLQAWNQETRGGLMVHYYGIGQPTPKNFFSMLDHSRQPSTPKYQALMDYLGSPATFTPTVRRAPAPTPPIARAPVQQPVAAPAPRAPIQQQVVQQRPPQPQQPVVRAPVPQAPAGVPLSGRGLQGWAVTSTSAISPAIKLHEGGKNELSVLWNFANTRLTGRDFFHIFAIDSRGGRKLLMKQTTQDMREVGNMAQIYVEDISRYVGPPIYIQIEVSPGVQAVIEDVSY